jgi:alpha-N-acetylglucosamine transferase
MANKGIIIAVPRKYEAICLLNVQQMRDMNCMLPIEIWEIGEEITKTTRESFTKIPFLYFKNVNDHCENSKHWKGFQVKAFVLNHTRFEEVLLCDADVVVHQNPCALFDDPNYLETGTYFFKDLDKWQFSKLTDRWTQFRQRLVYKKFTSSVFYLGRRSWLRSLLPNRSPFFPNEWDYIYSNEIPRNAVKEAMQESGVVVMNKVVHSNSIRNIYDLNSNHKHTYKFVWGDKETYWIGCLLAGQQFYFNPTPGYLAPYSGLLTHDYNGQIFFTQKG